MRRNSAFGAGHTGRIVRIAAGILTPARHVSRRRPTPGSPDGRSRVPRAPTGAEERRKGGGGPVVGFRTLYSARALRIPTRTPRAAFTTGKANSGREGGSVGPVAAVAAAVAVAVAVAG